MHEEDEGKEKWESHYPKSNSMQSSEHSMHEYPEHGERRYMYRSGDIPVHMTMGDNMKEGASPKYRRMYMESKEMHHDSAKMMQDLENYLHELSNDVMQMVEDATPEEKQLMRQKLTTLATKLK